MLDCPSTPDGWRGIADEFAEKWNFAHICGAVDGKHVAVRCPAKSGSVYFNYKKFYSIILLAVVDANYKFLYIEVGAPGSAGDSGTWRDCSLGHAVEENRAGLPEPEPLHGIDVDMPYSLVGDDAFALRNWMMKPYPSRQLTREQRIFNYRLSRALRIVENAFGILANRFRCLLTTMLQEPKTVATIVHAACVLHNFIRIRNPQAVYSEGDRPDTESGNIIPGSWRNANDSNVMPGLERRRDNTANMTAKVQIDRLCAFFNSEAGSVPWQDNLL